MKKTGNVEQANDLHLLALLVAKRLRQEHWIDDVPTTGDYRIADSETLSRAKRDVQVGVNLGRGLKVVIYDSWHDGEAEIDVLIGCAGDIADKVADTRRDADATRAMVREVTAAAKREIAKAQRRGMPFTLTSVTLSPLQAGRDDQIVARVEHQALGRSLQLAPFEFHAEGAEDVVHAFAGVAEEQERLMDRRTWLDRIGATGTIDSVVVAALGAAGLDVPHVLTAMRDAEDWIVDFDFGEGQRISLTWDEGEVRAEVELGEEVHWNRGRLSFSKSPRTLKRLPSGSPLNSLFEHPFLNELIRIHGDYESEGEHLSVSCTGSMLNFDADSGRTWAA